MDTCRIRGSHSGYAGNSSLLGNDAMTLGVRFPIFRRRRSVFPFKVNQSKKIRRMGSTQTALPWRWPQHNPSKRRQLLVQWH